MCLCVVPLRRTPVQAYWSFSINAQHSATTNSPSFSVVSLISLYQPRNKTVTQIYRINLSNGFKSCESLYNSKLICNERMKEKLRFSVVGVHTHTHTHTHTHRHTYQFFTCVSGVTESIFGAFCFVVKQSESEAEGSLPSAVGITNCWNYTVIRL